MMMMKSLPIDGEAAVKVTVKAPAIPASAAPIIKAVTCNLRTFMPTPAAETGSSAVARIARPVQCE